MTVTKRTDLHGVVCINKPTGSSSNRILQIVKRHFAVKKAGHAGTLDPMASGMLIILLNEATKYSQFFLEAKKSYRATISFGSETDTGDAEGDRIADYPLPPALSQEKIEECLKGFLGKQQQTAPRISALKHAGKPLYYWARKGVEVPEKIRTVTFYELSYQRHTATTLEIEVTCSSGTYIRSLAMDIAKQLGTGGHLSALHRLWSAPFEEAEMIPLEMLTEAVDHQKYLKPIEALLPLPTIQLTEKQAKVLIQGQPIPAPLSPVGLVQLQEPGYFLGVGQVDATGSITPKRLVGRKVPLSQPLPA